MKSVKRKKKRAPFYSVLGGMLRMRRKTLKLTQRQIAKKLGHTDPSAVNGFETGRKPVPAAHLPKLARILGVNLFQLTQANALDDHRRRFAAEIRALNKRQGLS